MKIKDFFFFLEGKLWDSILKTGDITLPTKVHIVKVMGFPAVFVQMWELDQRLRAEEICFWIVELEKTFESPLDNKEITPVNPKGNQCWLFIGRTDAEAEAPTLWAPDAKTWLTGKKPWCWERQKAKGKEGGRGCVG